MTFVPFVFIPYQMNDRACKALRSVAEMLPSGEEGDPYAVALLTTGREEAGVWWELQQKQVDELAERA